MKIKPIYLYPGLIVVVIIVLILTTGDSGRVIPAGKLNDKEMPQDQIHKGMTPPGKTAPDKSNVSASVLKQMEILKKDMDENPGDTAKIKAYADFLLSAHQQDNAVPLYKKILKMYPKDNDTHFALAYIYYNKRDLANAEMQMDEILSYDKRNPQALYNKGAITAAGGNKIKAEKIWKDVVSKFPGTDAARLAQNALDKIK